MPPLAPPVIRGLINLRGQIVMAIDLHRRLKMTDRLESELPLNVVVRIEDGPIGLLADRVGDVVEVDEDTFEKPPATLAENLRPLIKGVRKLDSGLMHVLDTEKT